MDPMSAGATVIAFITLAFSATKTIHNVLSSIKDGPRVIRDLNDEISQLQSILGRISQMSFNPAHANDVTELAGLGQKCADDMTGFYSKLKRLNVSEADGRSGRLWRKLKHCFTEKDLEQMRQVIRGHVQLLTIRLTLMQTQQLSLSSTQSTEILKLLQQLKHDVATLQGNLSSSEIAGESPTALASEVVNMDVVETAPSSDSVLTESITRLMKLVEKKSCVIESDDSGQLVDDLEHLLKSVQRDVAANASAEKVAHPPQCGLSAEEDVSKELRLVASLFLSAPSFNINQNGPLRFLANIPQGTVIHHERKRKTIETADGVVTLMTNKRHTNNREIRGREFVSKLIFKPRNANTMLTLSVNQGQVLLDSNTNILPSIAVCNILPRNSLVFKLAADGNLQDLIGLVSSGKANWNDHDTNGQSLLHHAVFHGHVAISSFLIDQGLDVNEIAKSHNSSGELTALHLARKHPVMSRLLLAAGADPTVNVRRWPTPLSMIAGGQDVISYGILRQAFESPYVRYSDSETLESDSTWVNACQPNMVSPSMKFDPQQQIKKLEFLLGRGYTVLHRGEGDYTCLLAFFDPSLVHKPDRELWKDVLVYLVQNGADVHATGPQGETVSSVAYARGLCMLCYDVYSSFSGDLWDAVLDSCGYNIYEFRKHCPRRPFYNGTYTRQVFESLWQGKEHRCPYWNDEVWPEDDSRGLFMNSNGRNCKECYECFKADNRGSDSLCGVCGYCIAVIGCHCFTQFVDEPDPLCQHPRRRKVVWDKDDGRYILVKTEAAGPMTNDEQESSNEEKSDDEQESDEVSADEELRSIASPSGGYGDQPPATYAQPHLSWTTESPLWQPRIEPSVHSQGYATNDSPTQGELFMNPWQEDQPPETTTNLGCP